MKSARVLAILVVTFCLVNIAMAGWVTSGNDMYSDVSGNVGIGTSKPVGKLNVNNGSLWITEGSDTGGIVITQRAANSNVPAGDDPYLRLWVENNVAYISAWENDFGARVLSLAAAGGNVGIGTKSPTAKLDVAGEVAVLSGALRFDNSWNYSPSYRGTTYTGRASLQIPSSGNNCISIGSPGNASAALIADGPIISLSGAVFGDNVGIGTSTPASKLDVNGDASIRGNMTLISQQTGSVVMTLGEGLDYAEGFDVTKKEEASPGTVLVIDPANAGKLTRSTQAYDTKVAGIVAGAKSLGSGVRLGTGQFDQNVALAGRVYCNVDATETAVQPGDLLTTSATPGYAMKVSDYSRSQGAVLGKAMETLEQGKKGQILVLVALQ
jgi:hypothetical protein